MFAVYARGNYAMCCQITWRSLNRPQLLSPCSLAAKSTCPLCTRISGMQERLATKPCCDPRRLSQVARSANNNSRFSSCPIILQTREVWPVAPSRLSVTSHDGEWSRGGGRLVETWTASEQKTRGSECSATVETAATIHRERLVLTRQRSPRCSRPSIH